VNGRDFLLAAKLLLPATLEAAWRSAVSRAYYAAFHVARQLLEDLGFRVPFGERAHAYLWLRLYNGGHPQIRLAGQRLNDLRTERNRADYELRRPVRQAQAAGHVRLAEQLIQILDATSASTRTQITDAMKLYERDVLKQVTWHP
jgi:uncharacterized protein (UPF0332 family)